MDSSVVLPTNPQAKCLKQRLSEVLCLERLPGKTTAQCSLNVLITLPNGPLNLSFSHQSRDVQPKQYRHFSSSTRSIAAHVMAIPEPVMSSNARAVSWIQLIPLPLASILQFSANVNETGRFRAHMSNCPTVRTWNGLKQQFIEQIATWGGKNGQGMASSWDPPA